MLEILCVGLTTIDLTYVAAAFPAPGVKTQADSASLAVGGPSANAAIAATTLGAETALCSAFGTGPFAATARDELAGAGVRILEAEAQHDLPISSVFIDAAGNRSVVWANGAGASPAPPPGLNEAARQAKVVLIDGHYPNLALSALQAARRAGVTTIVDLGSWKPCVPSLIGLCDVAIASADFAEPGNADTRHADVLGTLLAHGASLAAVTHGSRPIKWLSHDGKGGEIAVPQFPVVATNGAGDVLHGACAYFISQGARPVDGLTAASKVATASCAQTTARIPLELVDELRGLSK